MANRARLHLPASAGDRIADRVAATMGSWRFIIAQTGIVALWIGLNLVAVALRWDPYPFILLNLLFSTQAAYAAPVIMMSQNRSAQKDRARDDLEAAEIEDLVALLKEVHQINLAQTKTLQLMQLHMARTA